ncbi:unnamed protein product, partial [Vitis vinifera]
MTIKFNLQSNFTPAQTRNYSSPQQEERNRQVPLLQEGVKSVEGVKSITYNFSSPISAVATIKPLTPSLSHPESCEGKWIADMETKVGEEECARNSYRPSF